MRFLHTSDWHLGHTLHGVTRDREHAGFLAWLLEVLATETPDALIIAGDVFDTATPPARAERAFYDFLAEAKRRVPDLDVVVVAGNHDSAVRLESTTEVLKALDVRVVGNLHRRAGEPLDTERLVVPLRGADGAVGAWVAAVPFLRPADLPPLSLRTTDGDDLVERVRAVYDEVLATARERQQAGQALVATGHATLVGAHLSEDSERKITGGLDGLPVSIFPDDVAYVALGHLHKAQAVGGLEHVRYCGSPIPLSLAEANYVHEVRLVTLDGERFESAIAHRVPRSVGMLRLPTGGPLPLDLTLALLAELPEIVDDESALPFLEVRIALDRHEPDLRRRVEETLAGKAVRLVKLSVTAPQVGPALAEQRPSSSLSDLDPREVFERAYRRRHEDDPPPELLAAFGELLDGIRPAPSEVAVPLATNVATSGAAAGATRTRVGVGAA